MDEYQIYVLKTDSDENDKWKPLIFKELQEGHARFGWSQGNDSDLLKIKNKFESIGYKALTETESLAWSSRFLLNIKEGDYLIYINMPKYGECTVVRVVGPYPCYVWDGWQEDDFKHFIRIDKSFLKIFNRNDRDIHPSLSRRLKLQRRYWQIYLKNEFEELLSKLKADALTGAVSTSDTRDGQLLDKIVPMLNEITNQIHFHNPEKKLEEFVKNILEEIRSPKLENVKRKSGTSDVGADLVFEFETGLPFGNLCRIEKCAVQVKSYKGELGYKKAISDIRNAFETDDTFTCGLIISTALNMTPEFRNDLDKLQEESKKPIGILIGNDLAKWFLKYGVK